MKRLGMIVATLALLGGYVWLATEEARDREADRPEPAPIGVTVDPEAPLDPKLLQAGGFDFAAVRWSPDQREAAAGAVNEIRGSTELKFAVFVPSTAANASAFEALKQDFPQDSWIRYRGKPLVYVFGSGKVSEQSTFSVIRIDNGRAGDQYWVSNPPNIKHGLITLTPGFAGGGVNIPRSEATLDQQELFAETNKDRAVLVLWQSWNVQDDRSALLPSLVYDDPDLINAIHPSAYAYDRVKAFNERWKRP